MLQRLILICTDFETVDFGNYRMHIKNSSHNSQINNTKYILSYTLLNMKTGFELKTKMYRRKIVLKHCILEAFN